MAIDIESDVPVTGGNKNRKEYYSEKLTEILSGRKKVGASERMFFTEQLSLLLETGISLHEGLNLLKSQSTSSAFIALLEQLTSDVAEGKTFSHALSRHPDVFPVAYVKLIAASENGGFMYKVLQQLLSMDEKRKALQSTLVSALTYPAFLAAFSLAVVLFVLLVVFPKFEEMFSSIADQLPLSTTLLMAASDVISRFWLLLMVLTGSIALGLYYWLKSPGGIRKFDLFKIKAPLIRDIFIQLYFVQSFRVMSLSLSHGVSVVDTLQACKEVVNNTFFRSFINSLETTVQEGNGISSGFSDKTFVPPAVYQMIATGEETGSLPKVMERIAEFYERELTRRLNTLSKLAEPAMLLVMGLVVGILVSSLILPIFKLSRAVQ